jgi:DNA-binding MarR family transcriptional regulator
MAKQMHVKQQLGDLDKGELKRLARVLRAFMGVDKSLPVSRALLFLEIAMEEGLTTTELSQRTGASVPVTTRQMLDIGEYDRHQEPGLGLVQHHTDLGDRRRNSVQLTPRGASLGRQVADLLRKEK